MEELAQRQVPVEICITSNLRTGICKAVGEHPVKSFFDQGVMVTLNTDDPALFRTTLAREYQLAQDTFGFTDEHLRELARNSFEASFLPAEKKLELLEKTRELSELNNDLRVQRVNDLKESNAALQLEILALRHQLGVLQRFRQTCHSRHYSVGAQTLTLRYVHSGGVASKLGDLNNPPGTGDLPGKRALLVQPEVSPRPVVITEIRSQSPLQMSGIKDDEVVQTLSADRADELGVWILPRGAVRISSICSEAIRDRTSLP